MNNSQLAHLWASRNRDSGKGSNFYFDGPTIYSYGAHYPLATFTGRHDANGAEIVLQNSRSYSSTTIKHHAHASNALLGLDVRVIRCPEVFASVSAAQANLDYLGEVFSTAIIKACRARTHAQMYIDDARTAQADARNLARAFNVAVPEFCNTKISDDLLRAAKYKADNESKARKIAKQRRQELLDASHEEKAQAWRNGENVQIDYGRPTMLRASRDGTHVETSRGAEVTAKTARKLFAVLLQSRGTPTDVRDAVVAHGFPTVDGFTLRSIREDGSVVIGCHTLDWSEISAFAASQGWK